jgi:hypothetical protein
VLDLPPGTLVAGRYQVVRLLGEGAVKRVFLAWDRLAQRQVALALLRTDRVGDPHVAARFSREARAASVLRSPYTVRVFDVGKRADGTRYLVSEAVLGRGLDAALAYGGVHPHAAGVWAAQILTALEEAHGRGVLHRDVKPENVLLAPAPDDPAGEVARLTDFGLAKILDGALEGSIALRTAQGVVMGTPEYMAPEQWRGSDLDARADLYAVGALLYEMLTGSPPFTADALPALCRMHHEAELPPMGGDVSDAARAYEPLLRVALAKDPDKRFRSAAAMRHAVQTVGAFTLPPAPTEMGPPPEALLATLPSAELLCDALPGPVQLLAGAEVVLGRTGHIVARCLPPGFDNDVRMRTVSRRHARLGWKGGAARVLDLQSAAGTTVNGRRVEPDAEGVALTHGDVLGLGPHVRFVYEHGPAAAGELPPWARLARVDKHGGGLVHVLVLLEATAGAGAGHALPLPVGKVGDAVWRVRARAGALVAAVGDDDPVALTDGQRWTLGRTRWNVALLPPPPVR